MTPTTPLDQIAQLLAGAGYRRLETPLHVAGLTFDFPVAFVGMPPSPDLILAADMAFETDQRVLRKVEGIARALDVVRSKRPLTTVLAGPRPSAQVLDALTKVCRVLPVGTVVDDDPDTALRNWLAVLLPLNVPTPSRKIADPLGEIAPLVSGLHADILALVHTATKGADAVQAQLHEVIGRALEPDEDPS